jgi:flagellar basal-body rod modification protein FlgD
MKKQENINQNFLVLWLPYIFFLRVSVADLLSFKIGFSKEEKMDGIQSLNIMMSPEEIIRTSLLNDAVNKQIGNGKTYKNEMDKDAFLKLLLTQLANQDPIQPLEDKDFIAQMAQFSTLEQMNNMSTGFEHLSAGLEHLSQLIAGNNAFSLLGKIVEIASGNEIIKGKVEKVTGGDTQQIFVNGMPYDYQSVTGILTE